ncbi:hypothetical protein MUK42_36976 [Musa troglodytarum]|uniref:Uncharacterized protein n=1 Tax=Musa troglodytarum TaxID=320322 RepID=A0A9E7EAT1_9LILI|nr:hypothetical protein MUK42_36976 [Musa troglodytarum]
MVAAAPFRSGADDEPTVTRTSTLPCSIVDCRIPSSNSGVVDGHSNPPKGFSCLIKKACSLIEPTSCLNHNIESSQRSKDGLDFQEDFSREAILALNANCECDCKVMQRDEDKGGRPTRSVVDGEPSVCLLVAKATPVKLFSSGTERGPTMVPSFLSFQKPEGGDQKNHLHQGQEDKILQSPRNSRKISWYQHRSDPVSSTAQAHLCELSHQA